MAELQHLKNIIDNVIVTKAGTFGVAIIRRRTLDGKFLPGSSDDAGNYSTKPFAMPFGALPKSVQGKALKKSGPQAYQVFTSKNKSLWVVVYGGYKKLRSDAGKDNSKVTLNWSGRMMRNLKVLPDTVTKNSVHLGFDDKTAETIAGYHNNEGAGKSKRKHVFMDFTQAEKDAIAKIVGDEIAAKLLRVGA
jgi:hypothetical protein